jgi:hypothetical protein
MANKGVWKMVAHKYWVNQEKSSPSKKVLIEMDTMISHEGILKTITSSHLLLMGFYFSLSLSRPIPLLGLFISYLGGTPNRVG